MPKRNRNRNGNYFKMKIVAYWPVVSAKVQYLHTVLLGVMCSCKLTVDTGFTGNDQ